MAKQIRFVVEMPDHEDLDDDVAVFAPAIKTVL
jgi:hypothetical protein